MKKQNWASVTACFVLMVVFFVLENNLSIVSKLNVSHSSTHQDQDKKSLELKSITRWDPHLPSSEGSKIWCDRSHEKYDICSINAPTVLDPTISTFFVVDSSKPSLVENIRPYPRKWEIPVMNKIQEVTISSGPPGPKCEVNHNAPAMVFSLGGYTGNFWHEFNDGFVPLFITVNSFFPDQDFVLVISRAEDWWVSKYTELLHAFSTHRIVNLDNDTTSHCFTSATLGLISHGFVTIDPTLLPNSKSFLHFRALIDKAYSSSHGRNQRSSSKHKSRPRLVLTSRRGNIGRVILNEAKMKRVAREIGFDVIIFRPNRRTPLHESYALINSSHAMIGVHGAALTHSLFLRPGSVFVQVVPIGLEWVAEVCFEASARAMGLEYMEYRINAEESSLIKKYDKNDLVIKDPVAFRGKDWSKSVMNVYLKEQNVKLDLSRFREYMQQVYDKAKQFMDKEG